MRATTHRPGLMLRRVSAVAAAAIFLGALSLSATASAAEDTADSGAAVGQEPPVMTFMTEEEYRSTYLKVHGTEAPSDLSEVPTSPVPQVVQDTTGELIDTTQKSVADQAGAVASEDGSGPQRAVIPGGGGGGSGLPWWSVLYSYSDLKRNKVFIRYGNSALGYHHFASKHNLRNRVVFEHLMATKPTDAAGARLEYTIYVADPSNGNIAEKIFIVSQQATRTDDNKWKTPDGGYIGVITAYCKGKTKCPEFVNKLRR
ncbi:hypothetical protein ACPCHT_17725 [Nucisporomicrobium flavum]|jgi:hypothetical protein|uniref:hypothetical protein n=1 Tax=Nucisporomicrobium flavum TaxID=2785915 RepID=UPI003C2ED999